MFYGLSKLTWHHGAIPADEVWVKIGGDKGGSSFNMNSQIVMSPTCVFLAFHAPDTITNLYIALDRYKDSLADLNKTKWR